MKIIAIIVMGLLLLGCEKPNSKATYGETGLPKNCRAIIKVNVEAYYKVRESRVNYAEQMHEIDGIIDSINRNCGEHGYSWENK